MDDWNDEPDPDRGDPLDDFVELWGAENPEALWKVLTLRDGLTGAHPFEALGLFRRHHDNGEPGAVTTALLLCTASRWGRDTARLIAGLVDTAVLVEEDLDELASTFLWSDQFRFEYPAGWIGSEWISIDLEGSEGPVSIPLGRVDPDSAVPAIRFIAPPLRRWATARLLRADSRTLARLRARAAELGPIDGGAIASGVLDAVEVLDAGEARIAIELGLGWPRGSVRLLALDVLAAIDPEGATRRAATDPDRKVRAWSPARLRPKAERGPDGGKAGRHDPLGAQAELFPE
ncbi:MAG: hypothetical protein IVW53_14175 [Chloroflexi bacterium]|nr:hypothetical protein [Chloroflexota bacterium]